MGRKESEDFPRVFNPQVGDQSMDSTNTWDTIVIGGGIAGTAVAQRAAMNNDRVLLLLGDRETKRKSRSLWVKSMHNIPGLHGVGTRQIIKDTLSHLEGYGEQCTVLPTKATRVQSVDKDDDLAWEAAFEVTDEEGLVHHGASVVLCTGMMDVQPEIGDSIKPILRYANQQQVNYCLRCDGHLTKGRGVATIGHGDGAGWTAILLHERYGSTQHILLNGEAPEFSDEVLELLERYNVIVHPQPIQQVHGKPTHHGDLEGIELADGSTVPAEIAFVSLGGIVYNEFAASLGCQLDDGGYVVIDEHGESTINNVFAVGDVTSGPMKQVYTAWEYAVRAADAINARKRMARRRAWSKEHKNTA